MTRRNRLFKKELTRLFKEHVYSNTPSDGWSIKIPTDKDEHRIRLILSWKYGTDALSFTSGQMLFWICHEYKTYDPMDYYFRQYEEHVF